MSRQAGLELLDDLVGQVRAGRSAFEPVNVTARRVWDARRGELRYQQVAPFALTGAGCVRQIGGELPGFHLDAVLVAAIVAGGVSTPAELAAVSLADREMLACVGFVALAGSRLLDESAGPAS